jgi:hypothetical protein
VSYGGHYEKRTPKVRCSAVGIAFGLDFSSTRPTYAENNVMGEIQFEGKSHVEKTSGFGSTESM